MRINSHEQYDSTHFNGLEASNTEFNESEFDNCTFTDCNFSEATFSRCRFDSCEFINCNLSLAKMGYSKFMDVSFRESKLVGVNWVNVAWPRFTFNAPIQFYQCIINDSSFYGLSLQELVLEECKAHYVDFREADLSQANFGHSDLTGSLFSNTNLTEANLGEASNYDINVYQNTIKDAKFTRFEALSLLDSLDIELLD